MLSGLSRKKINVAFLGIGSPEWMGGVNYLRNLLFAISTIEDSKIKPYVFVGRKVDDELIDPVRPYSNIIKSSLFDRKSFSWFVWKFIFLLTGSNWFVNRLLLRHKIDVVSHSSIWGKSLPFKLISWIPDFQHIHLPEMFSKYDIQDRNKNYKNKIITSDCVIVSSSDSFSDLKNFYPKKDSIYKVLRFVSQPYIKFDDASDRLISVIERKYAFSGKYFYLPNQFWKHKNHQVVFESIKLLKAKGIKVLLLCSGHLFDMRNKDHISKLEEFIKVNNLYENIRLLGVIEYEDVMTLMRNSVAVINPSFFEGWSSTVEEAKSMGKKVILSRINVHKEQNAPSSDYFDPCDYRELACLLGKNWLESNGGPDVILEKKARKLLPERTLAFGIAYQDIVLSLYQKHDNADSKCTNQ